MAWVSPSGCWGRRGEDRFGCPVPVPLSTQDNWLQKELGWVVSAGGDGSTTHVSWWARTSGLVYCLGREGWVQGGRGWRPPDEQPSPGVLQTQLCCACAVVAAGFWAALTQLWVFCHRNAMKASRGRSQPSSTSPRRGQDGLGVTHGARRSVKGPRGWRPEPSSAPTPTKGQNKTKTKINNPPPPKKKKEFKRKRHSPNKDPWR